MGPTGPSSREIGRQTMVDMASALSSFICPAASPKYARPSSHGSPHDPNRYALLSQPAGSGVVPIEACNRGHAHQRAIGRSIHPGFTRANAGRSKSATPSSAAAGATHALVSSMLDGTASPVIQYGNMTASEPGG